MKDLLDLILLQDILDHFEVVNVTSTSAQIDL